MTSNKAGTPALSRNDKIAKAVGAHAAVRKEADLKENRADITLVNDVAAAFGINIDPRKKFAKEAPVAKDEDLVDTFLRQAIMNHRKIMFAQNASAQARFNELAVMRSYSETAKTIRELVSPPKGP